MPFGSSELFSIQSYKAGTQPEVFVQDKDTIWKRERRPPSSKKEYTERERGQGNSRPEREACFGRAESIHSQEVGYEALGSC